MLNVESGSGASDSDSYVTVAECDAYHLAHGGAAWALVADKEAALRMATIYLDTAYRWRGTQVVASQALRWPRSGVTVDGFDVSWSAVPEAVKRACCELAAKGALFADVSAQYVTDVQVGPIKRTMSGLGNNGQVRYAVVDAMVRDLVSGGSGSSSVQVVRA